MARILAESRRTLALAAPIAAGHVGQMLMGWADAAMIGRVGVVPLAACAFANTLLMVPFVFGFGVISSVSVRAAIGHGAADTSASGRALRAGVLLAIATGLLVTSIIALGLPWLGLFGQPADVVEASGTYLLLCGISVIPALASTASKNFCEALSRPWIPFWILLGAVGLNAFLNWILIFGKLGMPALGLEGAGWATLLARCAGAAAMLAYPLLSRRLRAAARAPRRQGDTRRELPALLALGLPVGLMHLGEVSGFAAGSLMMGWISVEALAAHQIAITCAATSFMVPLGLSQAVCVRVGQARGARDLPRCGPIVAGGLGMATLAMLAFAAVFVFLGKPLASVFTSDPALVELAARLLVVAGLFQVLDGLQIVSSGTLRGFEDVRVPMVIGIFSYWIVALPVSYLVAFVAGVGAVGVWIGFSAGLLAAAIALLIRVRRHLQASRCKPHDTEHQ